MKKCPYCAEDIQEEAIKCKHCNELLVKTEDLTCGNCPGCGSLLSKDSYYCPGCGERYANCTDCGSPTLENSTCCPKCGVIQIDTQSTASSMGISGKKKPQNVPTSVVISILFAVIAVISYNVWEGDSSSSAAKKNPMKEDNSIMAWAMSHEFVNRGLKAPLTAKYSSFLDSNVYNEGNQKYTVDAYVDSQNSFGASLRQYYRCQLEYIVSTEKWHLTNLQYIDSMP